MYVIAITFATNFVAHESICVGKLILYMCSRNCFQFCGTWVNICRKTIPLYKHCARLSSFFIHFAISMPPGFPWEFTDPEEPIEFDFLGLECNHQALKQLIGIFNDFLPFLRGFWVLVALKLDGHIPNLENRILWNLPDL